MTTPTTAWSTATTRSPVHRAPVTAKLTVLVALAVVVVALPREWLAAVAMLLTALVITAAVARLRPVTVLRRMAIDLPFLVFALLMPLVATGPRIRVLGVGLSVAGLWGAWALVSKATLTVLAAVIFASTTEPRQVVQALERLRLPRELTSIMAFMVRYLDLIADEARRMRIARESRGFVARGPRSWCVIAAGIGALFIRGHARGERVHLAMLARGGR